MWYFAQGRDSAGAAGTRATALVPVQSAADTSRYLHVLLERAPYTRTNRGCLQGVCALASQWCRSTARDVPVAAKKEKELQVEKRTRLRDVEASTVASWTIKAAKWSFA